MAFTLFTAYDMHVLLKLLEQPIVGNNLVNGAAVNGLTLIFTNPSATVTFSGTNPMSAEDIVNQINVQTSSGVASLRKYTLAGAPDASLKLLYLSQGDSGTTLSSTGTANAILGFSTDNDSTQVNVPAGQIRSVQQGGDRICRAVVSPDVAIVDGSSLAVVTTPGAGATYSPASNANLGAAAQQQAKGSPGSVLALQCHNLNTSVRYIQLHNTTSVLSGGEVPVYVVPVPGNGTVIVGTDYFTDNGMFFSTGIRTGFSTTEATYTAGAAGDQVTFVRSV